MKKTMTSFTRLFMPFGFAGNIYLLGAIGQGLGPVPRRRGREPARRRPKRRGRARHHPVLRRVRRPSR